MTMKLELSPEVQAGLLAQAQESGLSLEVFVQRLLSEKSRAGLASDASWLRAAQVLASDEWLCEFDAWVESHAANPVVLPDEAMERESIYGDHGN